jgi:hypothetical protein
VPECPRCHQPVETQAIACPHCRAPLKAHGHPGINLYRAEAGDYLCKTCIYDADDTCTYPQRPYAQECTLYTTAEQLAASTATYTPSRMRRLSSWLQNNAALLVVGLIVLVSLAIALGRT